MTDGTVLKREGHSAFAPPALNTAGIVYTAIVVVYTGLLLYGLGVLWMHRRKTAVRIRGLFITTAAVLSIHAYVAALFIVYPLNGAFKCGTEFWYMNTVFPFGIATFQAGNVRLWSYAKAQERFLEMKCFTEAFNPLKLTRQGIVKWFKLLDEVKKTYLAIAMGLVIQLGLAFILFFGSRRFSPSIGFFGVHTNALLCRRGYEWIPSVVWQFVWTWCYGPWVLFKTRYIKDTHYWALQTRLAVLAGLPGTPLWLVFLYNSNRVLASIDAWFPPAMWFAPGLMVMQITAVFFPAYDIYRQKKTKWPPSPISSVSSVSTTDTNSSTRKSKDLAISLAAFEHQLKHNLPPLLEFSTKKDFTSENIIFLRDVRNFKLKWRRYLSTVPKAAQCISSSDMRNMYEDAARIYFELICPKTAKFAINLDSKMYRDLEIMFRDLKYEPPLLSLVDKTLQGQNRSPYTSSRPTKDVFRKVVAPWDSPPAPTEVPILPTITKDSSSSETALIEIAVDGHSNAGLLTLPPPAIAMPSFEATSEAIQRIRFEEPKNPRSDASLIITPGTLTSFSDEVYGGFKGKIVSKLNGKGIMSGPYYVPSAFGLNVFDTAYESIKYLVYNNTWRSFVQGLDDTGIEKITGLWTRPPGLIPRRGLRGESCGKLSHITDVEMFDLNLELQAERETSGIQDLHHGVLDRASGPEHMDDAYAKCSACRNKVERKVEQLVRKAGFGDEHDAQPH